MYNVPDIRFRLYEENWERKAWADVVDISKNMVDPLSGAFDNLPHIGPGNIESFTGMLIDNIKSVGEEKLISGKFYFDKGDIVYGKINPHLAKYVIPDFNGLASADAYILNAKNGLEQLFLFYILQTKAFYNYTVSVSQRTGMPKINRDELSQYKFLAPSIDEQAAIGNFFHILSENIALHKNKLDKLKKLKKAYLQKMFPKEGENVPIIRFVWFTEPWGTQKLGDIAPLRYGFPFKSEKFQASGVPIIRITNIDSSGIVGGEFVHYKAQLQDERFSLHNNAILIAMSGATTGKVAILNCPTKQKFYQNQRVGYFTSTKKTDYNFIAVLVHSNSFASQLKSALVAGAQPNISSKEIDSFMICIPNCVEEHMEMGKFFLKLDGLIAAQQDKLTSLQQLKVALLQRMLV